MPKHNLTKATDISKKVRNIVLERDRYCVVCGSPYNLTLAHYISRSHMGKGIPKNLVTLCINCHHAYDNGKSKERADEIKLIMKSHLVSHYRFWKEEDLKYKKGLI